MDSSQELCSNVDRIRAYNRASALAIAIQYSKPLDNYVDEDDVDEDDVEKKMDEAHESRIGWGYLMGLSKQSDLQPLLDYRPAFALAIATT